MARTFLGRDQHLGGYRQVYRIEGGLEVDEHSFVEIERTRVYYDDILGITYHKELGVAFLVITGICSVLFLGIAGAIYASTQELAAALVMVFFAAPFLLGVMLRLIFRVDVITVYGRRTKARMRFFFRKALARQIFLNLANQTLARQEIAAAVSNPPPVAPAPEPPPPPAPGPA